MRCQRIPPRIERIERIVCMYALPTYVCMRYQRMYGDILEPLDGKCYYDMRLSAKPVLYVMCVCISQTENDLK
jgi:hypothetical protein